MNSFAGIFWLVLAQLQNRYFVEHLPVAAYVRLEKKKKWNSVFLFCSVWHSSLWHCKIQSGNKNKLRTFQPQIWKKIRTASLKRNLLVLIKKKSVNNENNKILCWVHLKSKIRHQNNFRDIFRVFIMYPQRWTLST